jgi:hypothetical protein
MIPPSHHGGCPGKNWEVKAEDLLGERLWGKVLRWYLFVK